MAVARRVAATLDIPFFVIDAKEIFRETVVQGFLDGYGRGETPNPCLVCNRGIRWTFLLEHALALGADFMATGHYARLRDAGDGGVKLLRSADASKDQSYVLHVLGQDKLKRALFPVGEYEKTEIRRLAEVFQLPAASRPDSQDLCFLAGGDYRDFLRRNRPEMLTPGKILDPHGAVLGDHSGLANYTIGQRKGLGVSAGSPLYVLSKDAAANTLVVGTEEDLGSNALTTGEVHWTSGEAVSNPFRAHVQTRYTAKAQPAEVIPLEDGSRLHVRFDSPQRDITAGQAAVIYQDDVVLGGGIIQ
jgi:tRNA-specific 2-thiouridylase